MLRCSAAFSANGHDSVFHTQKSPQRGGQASGQFLPGQHLAPGAKSCGSYAAQSAPGSGTDIISRILAPEMTRILGQTFMWKICLGDRVSGPKIHGRYGSCRRPHSTNDRYSIPFCTCSLLRMSVPMPRRIWHRYPICSRRPSLVTNPGASWSTFSEMIAYAKTNPESSIMRPARGAMSQPCGMRP